MDEGPGGPDHAALALYTSGTAALPKLVLLTHTNICTAANAIRDAVELDGSDRCLSVMPLFHIHGLSAVFASLAAGASVACMEEFSAAAFFQFVEEFCPTWYTAAPAIHRVILEEAPRRHAAPSGLRFVRSASAAMPRRLHEDIERVFGVPVIEAYGMTEAGPQISSNRLEPSNMRAGSVGRAAGPEIAIRGEAGMLPPGQVGEIVIRGPNVIRQYGGLPDGGDDPFFEGWLRTGDLGYLDQDGFLFITGRRKEIINRGGEKISPREVEELLLEHPAVANAVVFQIPHEALGEGVAAAVVLRDGQTVTEAGLRRFVAERLASFKAPQTVLFVDAIPITAGGKVERSGLAAAFGMLSPGEEAKTRNGRDLERRAAVQERVAGIWAVVLGIERPELDDDFFRCGGHSLNAMQVMVRLRDEFGVELENDSLFAHPTVAELSDVVLEEIGRVSGVDCGAISIRTAPLSFAQERLWFLDQIEPGNPAYNICSPLSLTGVLDPRALEQALNELRSRHQTLRTTFSVTRDEPVQVIAPAEPTPLPLVDLTTLPGPDREEAASRLVAEDAMRPFDLTQGPLFRTSLLRLGSEEHVLLITAHHIISDGWSTGVLCRELGELYRAIVDGTRSTLQQLQFQYSDFAIWQRETLQGKKLDNLLGYWQRQLAYPPPALDLPTDRPRPPVQSYRGARTLLTLSSELTARLRNVSLRENATLFMTAMAAFQTLLFRYSGQTDFLLGTPIANRTRLDTEPLIGFFANTLVLRASLSGDPMFRELLDRVKATARAAYAHQDLPFEKLVDALNPERNPDSIPLFRVMFSFQNVPEAGEAPFALAPGLTASPFSVERSSSKFDLTVYVRDDGQTLHTIWQYNVDLFDAETVQQLAKHFETLLTAIALNPEQRLLEYPLLTKTELLQIESACTGIVRPELADGSFPRIFEEQVARSPEAIALICGQEQVSYAELNAEANRLARYLQQLGVGPEDRVAICLPRSTHLASSVLAVLKTAAPMWRWSPTIHPNGSSS